MKNQHRAWYRRGLILSGAAALVSVSMPASAIAGSPVVPRQAPVETTDAPSPTDSMPLVFDPDQPFEVVPGSDTTQPHVDTIDGVELTPSEIEAVFARADFDPGPGRALATTTRIYDWRGTAEDPDIRIEADANVPIEVVQLLGEVFVEWREVIDLDIPAPEWHHIRLAWVDDLEPGVLGGAATGWVTVNQNGSTFVVPRFLANVNGASTSSGAYALDLVLNSQINWDYTLDPDDSQPNSAYYLKTVMLHEVGHALGVASGVDREQAINSSVLSTWGATFFGNKNA